MARAAYRKQAAASAAARGEAMLWAQPAGRKRAIAVPDWRLLEGNLSDRQLTSLLEEHCRRSLAESGGPQSCHALEPRALQSPEVSFWSLWQGGQLLAIGAVRRLPGGHGEIKSMHTVERARRRGAGSALLAHLLCRARDAGLSRLSLETGAAPYFAPARAFYQRHGFVQCPPFGDYRPDPNSVFMTRPLTPAVV
jgi:putative acetyltransferase